MQQAVGFSCRHGSKAKFSLMQFSRLQLCLGSTHPPTSFRVSRPLTGDHYYPFIRRWFGTLLSIHPIIHHAAGAIELTQGDDVVHFRSTTTSEKETDVRASDQPLIDDGWHPSVKGGGSGGWQSFNRGCVMSGVKSNMPTLRQLELIGTAQLPGCKLG